MDNDKDKPFTAKVTLCDLDGQTKFSNWLEIKNDGVVSMSSIEVGTSPNQFLGAEDHENFLWVNSKDKDALLFALLKDRYQGNAGAIHDFKQFLTANSIPFTDDFWVSFN